MFMGGHCFFFPNSKLFIHSFIRDNDDDDDFDAQFMDHLSDDH